MTEGITIFADGACSNNGNVNSVGGWGAVLEYNGNKKELYGGEKPSTNNRMEIVSCIQGLLALKTDKLPVTIYSDSAYVCNCMTKKWYENWQRNGWKTSKKEPVENRELWEQLLILKEKYNPNFVKVKGHSDNEGNAQADKLAQYGIDEIKPNVNKK